MLFWGIAPMTLLLPWMAAFTVMCVVRIVFVQVFKRAEAADGATGNSTTGALDLGSNFAPSSPRRCGAGRLAVLRPGTALEQTGLIVIVYTFCAVASVLSIQRRLYLCSRAGVFAAAGAHPDGRRRFHYCSRASWC